MKNKEKHGIKLVINSKVTRKNGADEPEITPVEKIIENMKPNDFGLYPHEILLLSYASKYKTVGNEYPKFWWYDYGIRDVDVALKSLKDRDFLKIGSLKSAIENETVAVLKDILKNNNMKVSGKKAQLVQRILEELPEKELKNCFTKYTYELTDSGKTILDNEKHILYIHRHRIEDLDIWSLNKMVQERAGIPYRDVIWGYMNQRSMIYLKNGDFGLYRNCRFSMSEFVMEEGRLENSISLLAEIIRFDLSGLSNNFSGKFMDLYIDMYFPYKDSILTVAPGIINRVRDYQNRKSLSDNELKMKLLEDMRRIQLPFSVFTVNECAEIVLLEINEDKKELGKLYNKAKRRYKKEYGIK